MSVIVSGLRVDGTNRLMKKHSAKSLYQLTFKRKWLVTQLEAGKFPEESQEHDRVFERLEEIDLAIAASPAHTLKDVIVKLERFAALYHPAPGPIPEDTLEFILLKVLLDDCRRLAAKESEASEG